MSGNKPDLPDQNAQRFERDETDGSTFGIYEVGYGRPPLKGRIKKGEVRNKRGRPKGSRNHRKILEDATNSKTTITEKGKRRTVTKFELSILQLSNKAASGDLKAISQLHALIERSGLFGGESATEGYVSNDGDRLVMEDIVARIRACEPQQTISIPELPTASTQLPSGSEENAPHKHS